MVVGSKKICMKIFCKKNFTYTEDSYKSVIKTFVSKKILTAEILTAFYEIKIFESALKGQNKLVPIIYFPRRCFRKNRN